MTTAILEPYALSVDFDKDYIKYGIHKLTTYSKKCKQTSVMIFGLIITWGYFI